MNKTINETIQDMMTNDARERLVSLDAECRESSAYERFTDNLDCSAKVKRVLRELARKTAYVGGRVIRIYIVVKGKQNEKETIMIGTILLGCAAVAVLDAVGKVGDTRVKYGKDIFGKRYKTEDGPCCRCDGTVLCFCRGVGRFA